jgi:hypothetical protein
MPCGGKKMPVRDLGYRSWHGGTRPESERVTVIAETGVRLAWRSLWLRRMLLLAWTPAILVGLFFFMYENAAKNPGAVEILSFGPFGRWAGLDNVGTMIRHPDPAAARHAVWARLILFFFRNPQGTLLIMLVGLIAPPLIAQDMRTRAYLIYFSRPLATWEYALGKAAIVCIYLAMITTVPALCLYVLGVLLSPDISVLQYTWDLPLRICVSSIVVMIPTTSLALCYSSLTRESRYAGFAWFATWILGWVAFTTLTVRETQLFPDFAQTHSRWTMLSLYNTLGVVQSWIFGLEQSNELAANCALLLAIITVISWGILLRRIEAPLRE